MKILKRPRSNYSAWNTLQVNKSKLLERIAEIVKNGIVEGISDLRDESDRNGVRVVIELKKDVDSNIILNQLYKHTLIQTTFNSNMLALNKGKPEQMNLKEILSSFLDFREEVIIKRTLFDLNKAREKAHILEGLAVALSNIDEIIKLIKESKNSIEAKTKLLSMKYKAGSIKKMLGSSGEQITKPNGLDENIGLIKDKYIFSDTQAQAILEMKLSR